MERITVEQVENSERFYRLPKALFELDRYKKMSSDSKFLYAILKDRAELSIKNKWIDSEGCVYFIFTIDELKEMTGWGKDKIIKLKKELAKFELLEEERKGLNKPNRLYLGKIKIELSTGFKPVKSTEVGKSEVRKSEKPNSRSRKIRSLEVDFPEPNDTDNSDTDYNGDSMSRKANPISKEIPSPAGAMDLSTPEESVKYIQPEYYSLLQVIADRYNGKFTQLDLFTGEFQNYKLTHYQKMMIGQYLSYGYVTSGEVLDIIERIPIDSESPLAYLLKCLENLKEERRLEAKMIAHRNAEMKYEDSGKAALV